VPRARYRGFTLVEVAVTIAIIAIVVALAYPTLARTRPRAQLSGAASELQALMYRSRQEALARGRDVVVIFYPGAGTATGTGLVLAIADDAGGFAAGAAPPGALDYCTTSPALAPEALARIELPRDLTLSAPARAQAFPFPYSLVPAPAAGCSFCTGVEPGGGPRGAVRFDSRGRASFFANCGAPSALPNGGSVALSSATLQGSRVLAVLPTGSVRTFSVE
jgi:prepilin-type N-terminal cleavage/methylation domain-containing protein